MSSGNGAEKSPAATVAMVTVRHWFLSTIFVGIAAVGPGAQGLELEKNLGQWESEILFASVERGSRIELRETSITLQSPAGTVTVGLGGCAESVFGMGHRSIRNYYLGNDPKRWLTDVPAYERVRFEELSPGVSAEIYERDGAPEFDILFESPVNLSEFRFEITGQRALEIRDGDLVALTSEGEIRILKPFSYQVIDGNRTPIDLNYRILDETTVVLDGSYDEDATLVVDPVIRYSTYFGGEERGEEAIEYIGRDAAGFMYLAGSTDALEFPGASNRQMEPGDWADSFVTKLTPDGTRLLWTTFIGGSSVDRLRGNVTASGRTVLAGFTRSVDFPMVQPLQSSAGGSDDLAIARFDSEGKLVFSTFLGGNGEEFGSGRLDRDGNLILVGTTRSAEFVTRNALYPKMNGGGDAFFLKMSPENELLYSSFFGGKGQLDGGDLLAIAPDGSFYITGGVDASEGGIPLVNPLQETYGGYVDSYLAHVAADGQSVIFSTLFGGEGHDRIRGGAADADGVVFTANTGADLPVKNAYQPERKGPSDVYIGRISADGSELEWATWFGGSGGDAAGDVLIDGSGDVWFSTGTSSPDMPLVEPLRSALEGDWGGHLARFSPNGERLLFATYHPPFGTFSLEPDGSVAVFASATQPDLPVINGFSSTIHGTRDGYLMILLNDFDGGGDLRILPVVGSLAGGHGSFFRTTVQLFNPSEELLGARFVYRPQNEPGTDDDLSYSFWLAPFQTLSIHDLLPVMGASGIGSIDVVTEPGATPVVISRIFNDGGDRGTTGMSQQQIAPQRALQKGDTGFLLAPPDLSEARFNVGVRSLAAGAVLQVRLRRADGELASTQERSFLPDTFLQGTPEAVLGILLMNDDSIEVQILEGSAIVYGATTDNKTQDPSMQMARVQRIGSPAATVPVVGSLAGAYGSFFRTAFQIHNPSSSAISGRILYRASGTPGQDPGATLDYELLPHETRSFRDLLPEMGLSGIGSVDVITEAGPLPVLVARIFNDAGEAGTTGMVQSGIAAEDALASGSRAVLLAPPSMQTARMNIGVRALEQGARIRAVLRNQAGGIAAEVVHQLAPHSFSQVTGAQFFGVEISDGDSMMFDVEEGAAIIYGATTDNITQDPSMQVAERLSP